MALRRTVVFDVDGTLVDASARVEYCSRLAGGARGRRFWDCMFNPDLILNMDTACSFMIGLLKRYLTQGWAVAVSTGRPETLREATVVQLKSIGIETGRLKALLMRPAGDYSRDHILKKRHLDALRSMRLKVEIWYDDSDRVIETLRKEGVDARKPPRCIQSRMRRTLV